MPSSQYFVHNPEGVYYLTMTVVDWVDVFTRPSYQHIIVDSLRYCQQHKVSGFVSQRLTLCLTTSLETGGSGGS